MIRGTRTWQLLFLSALVCLLAAGCGGSIGAGGVDADPNAPDADPNAPDADPNAPDANSSGCVPGATECSDCVDNDNDGRIDGFDPECTSALDDVESSFATGIPGDNIDSLVQDCFFDGNSGEGDDGCAIATCCLLDPTDPGCPPPGPSSCTPSQQCIDSCLGVTTPGCDCFGCCTICNSVDCYTVITNPAIAPDCTYDVIDDPVKCPPCTQVTECLNPCDPDNCILCPGQTENDLPPECNGQECANGNTPCDDTSDCSEFQYCSSGCCIDQIVQ